MRHRSVLFLVLAVAGSLADRPASAQPNFRRSKDIVLFGGYSDPFFGSRRPWETIPVATSNGDGTWSVTNTRSPQFERWASDCPCCTTYHTGDFNGDGGTDLMLFNRRCGGERQHWTTAPIAFSNGDGSFRIESKPLVEFINWRKSPGVILLQGRFDHDAKDDLALIRTTRESRWNTLPVALSVGDGSFRIVNGGMPDEFMHATLFSTPVIGDFDGNNVDDIAVWQGDRFSNSDELMIAFANGDGTFRTTTRAMDPAFGKRNSLRTPIAADVNDDGLTDMAWVDRNRRQDVLTALSSGDGSFRVVRTSNAGCELGFPGSAPPYFSKTWSTAGRWNGDRFQDFLWRGGEGYVLAISGGDGTFRCQSVLGGDFYHIARDGVDVYGDFNADGLMDLALTGGENWKTIPVAFSNGDTTFRITNQFVPDFPEWAEHSNNCLRMGGIFTF